jgi:hypothetical protein
MSFDVFLQRFAAGQRAEVNRERVHAVLEATEFTGPDDFGFYVVKFPDGVEVEFSAKGLDGAAKFTGCAFHIRGMSPHLVRFILGIAKAGDMVMLPAMEDSVPILSSPEQRQQLPSDLALDGPEPVVCRSSAELESLLSGGYAGWRRYRDRVINGNRGV